MNKHKEIIKKSCDLIKKSIKELSLKNLANQFNLSPSYFQKLFKQETGITPKEYAMAIRKNKAIELLNKKKKIIQIIYIQLDEQTKVLEAQNNKTIKN